MMGLSSCMVGSGEWLGFLEYEKVCSYLRIQGKYSKRRGFNFRSEGEAPAGVLERMVALLQEDMEMVIAITEDIEERDRGWQLIWEDVEGPIWEGVEGSTLWRKEIHPLLLMEVRLSKISLGYQGEGKIYGRGRSPLGEVSLPVCGKEDLSFIFRSLSERARKILLATLKVLEEDHGNGSDIKP